MVDKFNTNNKVHLLNVGISTNNKTDKLFMSGDGTSSKLKVGESIDVKFNDIETILNTWVLDSVDLIQMNIEGDEYSVLESMISNGFINKFKNVQVQFHLGVENDMERRSEIHKGFVKNGFKIKFNYPFVWECWTKK
jgi:FkbM family methyltransferase